MLTLVKAAVAAHTYYCFLAEQHLPAGRTLGVRDAFVEGSLAFVALQLPLEDHKAMNSHPSTCLQNSAPWVLRDVPVEVVGWGNVPWQELHMMAKALPMP